MGESVTANVVWIVAVFAAGALLPLQALINAQLSAGLQSPFWAAVVQNLVGALVMSSVIACSRAPAPALHVAAIPLWAWIGGALGMVYVFSALMAAPRLGMTNVMTAVIVGQLASAVLLDHFGVLHERRPLNIEAAFGVALLVIGAALVLRRN